MKSIKPAILKVEHSSATPKSELKKLKREFIKEIGMLIRDMRERQSGGRMSQEHLAKLLGMSRPNLAHIENGKQSISIFQLWRVAHYLNCEIDMLFPKNPETEYPMTKGERRTLENKDKKITKWVEKFKF